MPHFLKRNLTKLIFLKYNYFVGPLRVTVEFKYKLGEHSSMTQHVTLDAVSTCLEFSCHVDWHENRKFLKVEFPLAVHNDYATYSSQFGHIRRPTHRNTSVSPHKKKSNFQKRKFSNFFSKSFIITLILLLLYRFYNYYINMGPISGTWPSLKCAATTGQICPNSASVWHCSTTANVGRIAIYRHIRYAYYTQTF